MVTVAIAVVQAPARRGRPGVTRRVYDRLLGDIEADVILLPELALVGYDPGLDYAALAESEDGPTLRWAEAWAFRWNALVAVGLPFKSGKRFHNALALILPDGKRLIYAKRHLWGAEGEQFIPGRAQAPVFDFAGVRLAPLICYDMTFAEETAPLAGKIDLLLVASAWPWMSREHAAAGRDLARALATQLGAAVAWANQVGRCRIATAAGVGKDRGAGLSLITLPYRTAEARCPGRGAASATLTIDVDRLRRRRTEKFV